jgi:hypothetical protein
MDDETKEMLIPCQEITSQIRIWIIFHGGSSLLSVLSFSVVFSI